MKNKRTYDVDLNKVVAKTFKFLRNHGVPKHWSKTKNEKYDAHLMIALYVLFCMAYNVHRLRFLLSKPSVSSV